MAARRFGTAGAGRGHHLLGLGSGVVAATAWRMRRDLRRAWATAPLPASATAIEVRVRASSPRRQVRSARPLRLAALGDSAIAGIGADRVADSLAVQIARRVADATGRAVHVRGLGVPGARTADVVRQVAALAAGPMPDVVVVVVGANDIVHVTPPGRYLRDLTTLYAALRDEPGAPVVACSLPEVRAITIVGHPLRDVAVAYGRLLGVLQRHALHARPGVTLVDARRIAGPAFLQRPDAMASDGFHPSVVGYGLLAAALAPAVTAAAAPDHAGDGPWTTRDLAARHQHRARGVVAARAPASSRAGQDA